MPGPGPDPELGPTCGTTSPGQAAGQPTADQPEDLGHTERGEARQRSTSPNQLRYSGPQERLAYYPYDDTQHFKN